VFAASNSAHMPSSCCCLSILTDGLTDGIAIASSALAMRALRRAVKLELRRICASIILLIAGHLTFGTV